MRVCDGPEGPEICYPEKRSAEIKKLFTSRYNLHRDIYTHKTIQAYESMAVDVLLKTNGILYDYLKVIFDPNQYLTLDDSILDQITCSEDPRLQEAQQLLERMAYRNHYKCVGEKGVNRKVAEKMWKSITAE